MEEGYYWVKENANGSWLIAYRADDNCWYCVGNEEGIPSPEIIHPIKIEEPDED